MIARMIARAVLALAILAAPAHALTPSANPAEAIDDAACVALRLRSFVVEGAAVTIDAAAVVPRAGALPSHCRVQATIAPATKVEVHLPVATWSGRFLMAGCGGLCGAIQMERTTDALIRGYAVAHTDMGHPESATATFAADAEALVDFAHRATHRATVLAKDLIAAYYGRPARHAYFRGCSTGGRQGLTAALLYPDDFDGVVAGAPAAGPAIPNIAWAVKANLNPDGGWILDAAAVDVLNEAARAACDAADGATDGLIGHPPSCRIDPAALVCRPGQTRCLTPAQAAAATAIYHGHGGSLGFMPGGERGWLGKLVPSATAAPDLAGVAQSYLRRFLDAPRFPQDLLAFDVGQTPIRLTPLDELPLGGPDGRGLGAFRDAGGKLLLWHSWSDNSLTPATAIDVYRDQAERLGAAAADAFRLFLIPGMYHCRGGEGPDAVDFLTAIESWVERGTAPDRLVAAKVRTPVPTPAEYQFPLAPADIVFARPLFPYPDTAVFSGRGDWRAPEGWVPRRP